MKKFYTPIKRHCCLALAVLAMSLSVEGYAPDAHKLRHERDLRKPVTGTLTISASGNRICAGTSVTFTATLSGGLASPTYQWLRNGAIVGNNSTTYTNAALANQDVIQCRVTYPNATFVLSNPITMGVDATPTVTVTPNPSCIGSELTAAWTNTAETTLEWKKSGVLQEDEQVFYNPTGTYPLGTNLPVSVTKDAAGNFYVSEWAQNQVTKWAPGAASGVVVAGGNGAGSALNQLNTPKGIVVDAAGNVYVADYRNGRIMKWAPGASAGVVVVNDAMSFGAGQNGLRSPMSLYLDNQDNLYIPDFYYRVLKIKIGASSGVVVAGGNGQGAAANQLNDPKGTFVADNGDIYIADGGNHRIQKWAVGATSGVTVAGGNGAGNAANQFNVPQGVLSDVSGNLYILDEGNHRVQKWAQGATQGVTMVGGNGGGNSANQLSYPQSMYLDANNDLYVANASNKVMKFVLKTGSAKYTPSTTGSYTAVATTKYGCIGTSPTVTIGNPATPTVTIAATSTRICGGTSVTFTATPTNGGVSPTYQWKKNGVNVGTGSTYTNAALADEDIIRCIMTTSEACALSPTATSNSLVMSVTVPSISFNNPTILCNGGTATLKVTALGSSSESWVYKLNGGSYQAGRTFTVSAGTHTVTIKSTGDCTVPATITITQPAAMSVTAAATSITCNGDSSTLTATATGGTGAYRYSIDNSNFQESNIFSVPAGTYTVYVKDVNNCTAQSSATTITQPTAISVSASAGTIAVAGGSTTLTVTASGGTGTLRYRITGGTLQNSNTFTVTAGAYTVYVRDAAGCVQTTTIAISQPGTIIVSAAATAIACNGNNSTITVTANGGVAPLQYSKDGVTYQSTNTFTVPAGTYTMRVKDANNTVATATAITITQPTAITVSATAGTIACNGVTATLTATASGGTGSLTYNVNAGSYQASNIFAVSGGNQIVRAKDANGCRATAATVTVIEPAAIVLTVTVGTPIACNGGTTTLTLSATGGTGALEYSRNAGANYRVNGVFSSVAGTYTPMAKDANGCTVTEDVVTITAPSAIAASATAGTIDCNGGTTILTASASGGTGSYTYSKDVNTYQVSNQFTISAGATTVTVRDANGCTQAASAVTVTQPTALSVSRTTTPILCNGSTATITMTGSGGTSPYNYSVAGGTYNNSNLANVFAGTHTISIKDVKGCIATGSNVVLTQPTALTTTATAGTIACNGGTTTVTLSATGGTTPYRYNINGQTYQNSATFTVSAGTHTFLTKDASNCTVQTTVTVTEPQTSINITASANSICEGMSVTFTATVTDGGASPTYQWTLNGVNVGTGLATFTRANLVNGDAINCILTSNAACPNPAVVTNDDGDVIMTVKSFKTRVYIKHNATGLNDGTSWANAYRELNSAMQHCYTGGAEIWVAAGTYKPNLDNNYFALPDGVSLYGGFAGTETNLAQRNWQGNETILSADQLGNDVNELNTEENTAFLILADTLWQAARIDGFTFTGAKSAGIYAHTRSNNLTIENCSFTTCYVPILVRSGGTLIQNCKFTKNWSIGGVQAIESTPTIRNCIFKSNRLVGVTYAGGIYNKAASPTIENCVFENNLGAAGGIVNRVGSAPTLKNCVFWNNDSDDLGAAVYNENSNPTLINCTIAKNRWATAGGAAIYNNMSNVTLRNCILWGNTGAGLTTSIAGTGTPTIRYTNLEGGYAGTGNINLLPQFANILDGDGADNTWGTSDDGLVLACFSPSVNTGTAVNAPSVDIIGTARPQGAGVDMGAYEASGPTINLVANANPICVGMNVTFTATITNGGAAPTYQWKKNGVNVGSSQSTYTDATLANNDRITCVLTSTDACANPTTATSNEITLIINALQTRVYVKHDATGLNNGTSWANAYTRLPDALNVCYALDAEIWVARGTYKPLSADLTDVMFIPNGVKLYGGFAGTETTLEARDWQANTTIISADMAGNDNINDESTFTDNGSLLRIRNLTHATLIDGFQVRGGYWVSEFPIIIEDCGNHLTLSHNRFEQNIALLNIMTATVRIKACEFINNRKLVLNNGTQSVIYIENSIFAKNICDIALIENISVQLLKIENSLFVENTVQKFLSQSNRSTTIITNSTIYKNRVNSSAQLATNNNSASQFKNCIIWGWTGTVVVAYLSYGGTHQMTYSNMQAGAAGVGNINVNPQFRDVSDPDGADNRWGTADDGLQLTCLSPSLNTGSAAGAPSTDIVGTVRPQGAGVDMGAYERLEEIPTIAVTASANNICTGTNVTFTAAITNSGATPVYQWKKNGVNVGSSQSTYADAALANNDIITCVLTSTDDCANPTTATSNAITMTVNALRTRVYVKHDAGGANNGTSWGNAFTSLQAALTRCFATDAEIWVARGTYKPSAYPMGCTDCSSNRDYSFSLPANVKLYGGFRGTETLLTERNIATQVTTLSGDIDNDNILNDGNIHRVVVSIFADQTPTLLIDGFTITGSNANAVGSISLQGQNLSRFVGGGVYIRGGDEHPHPQYYRK